MHRTQIYLPKTQLEKLRTKAKQRQTTVSAVVRSLLSQELDKTLAKPKAQRSYKSLLETAAELKRLGVGGPKDLATNMDAYLYGGKK